MSPMLNNNDSRLILDASIYFNELFKRTIASTPFGISVTKTQMNILVALYTDGPLTMTQLSQTISIAPEQATRAINGLREKKLIESDRSTENRRLVIARLSTKGKLLMDQHIEVLRTTLNEALNGLNDEEQQCLVSAAQAITQLLPKTGFCGVLPQMKHSAP